MTSKNIVVLDYGSGNVHSVVKALETTGARVTQSADFDACVTADGLVVPGVGAFQAVMTAFETVRGGRIIDRRLAGQRAVLGICVGMQILFDSSDERHKESEQLREGLGQFPGTVTQLTSPRLPHMGWNTVTVGEGSRLFAGIESERYYFVHSFGVAKLDRRAEAPYVAAIETRCDYGGGFLAAIEDGPLTATQFHPEKSGAAGVRLLKNWVDSL